MAIQWSSPGKVTAMSKTAGYDVIVVGGGAAGCVVAARRCSDAVAGRLRCDYAGDKEDVR